MDLRNVQPLPKKERRKKMKDHAERPARMQLVESMLAGQPWQEAVAQSKLNVSRSTAYHLAQLARTQETAVSAFLDGRQGHPYKLTEKVQMWLVETCTKDPQISSSQVQANLLTIFGVKVSVGYINQVRMRHGITKPGRGRTRTLVKKNGVR
jgi:transposase